MLPFATEGRPGWLVLKQFIRLSWNSKSRQSGPRFVHNDSVSSGIFFIFNPRDEQDASDKSGAIPLVLQIAVTLRRTIKGAQERGEGRRGEFRTLAGRKVTVAGSKFPLFTPAAL